MSDTSRIGDPHRDPSARPAEEEARSVPASPACCGGRLACLADGRWANLAVLLAVLLALDGRPVPHLNEWNSLVAMKAQWDPEFLSGDWMLSGPKYQHLVFNFVCGLPTLVLPMAAVGWMVRVVTWILSGVALYRLGGRLSIPRWAVTAWLIVFLAYDQSLVAGECIFACCEAKAVAFALLLFSLDACVAGRSTRAAVLLGLTFSFQTAVGLWGGVAIWLGLLVARTPWKELLKIGAITTIFSLPGLLTVYSAALGAGAEGPEEWKFLALVRFPMHLDPLSWQKRDMALMLGLLGFNCIHLWYRRDDRAVRILTWFQVFLAATFGAGVLARYLEAYGFLRFFPFRLFPVFTLVLFGYQLANAWIVRPRLVPPRVLGLLALIVLVAAHDPARAFLDRARYNLSRWTRTEEDLERTFRWIEANTEKDAIVISPPWEEEFFYIAQRPQVVNAAFIPYGRMREWRERMEALVGDVWQKQRNTSLRGRVEVSFNSRSPEQIEAAARRYGGKYLVSRGTYPYPILHDSGSYKVYRLP